jgi:isoleucyl-tRNA synthetase
MRVFIDELSTWYVRRSRERFNDNDKDARETLAFVLKESSKVFAPIMPFVAEYVYMTLGEKESVHVQEWPKYDSKKIDKKLNEEMAKVREIVSLALKERDVSQISLKQPLAELELFGAKLSKEYLDLIADEVNVKKIRLVEAKELSVKLDTKLTPELEAEGYFREVTRNIQASRKKAGLRKEQKITLNLEIDKELEKMLSKFIDELKEKTGVKKLEINGKKEYSNKFEDKIREKRVKISFEVA